MGPFECSLCLFLNLKRSRGDSSLIFTFGKGFLHHGPARFTSSFLWLNGWIQLLTRSKQYSSHSVIKTLNKGSFVFEPGIWLLTSCVRPSVEFWILVIFLHGQTRTAEKSNFPRPQVAPIPEGKTTNSGHQKKQETWDKTLIFVVKHFCLLNLVLTRRILYEVRPIYNNKEQNKVI